MTIFHVIKHYHPDLKKIDSKSLPDLVYVRWAATAGWAIKPDAEVLARLKQLLLEYDPNDSA